VVVAKEEKVLCDAIEKLTGFMRRGILLAMLVQRVKEQEGGGRGAQGASIRTSPETSRMDRERSK
jgi:hypothetical protein